MAHQYRFSLVLQVATKRKNATSSTAAAISHHGAASSSTVLFPRRTRCTSTGSTTARGEDKSQQQAATSSSYLYGPSTGSTTGAERRRFVRITSAPARKRLLSGADVFLRHQNRRFFSTSSIAFDKEDKNNINYINGSSNKLRVAVVGGGCAGLSCALHLSPLVDEGLIAGPIDVYDDGSSAHGCYSDYNGGREIGVGIWSTALDPLTRTGRESHQYAYDTMETRGSWVGDVGYRIPNGSWLLKNRLPTRSGRSSSSSSSNSDSEDKTMPSLLFLREKDFLGALREATEMEAALGTVRVHRGSTASSPPSSHVCALQEDSPLPWSAKLAFDDGGLRTKRKPMSDRDYHLIVAADGTNSTLRQIYGGHSGLMMNAGGGVSSGSGDVSRSIMSAGNIGAGRESSTTTSSTSSVGGWVGGPASSLATPNELPFTAAHQHQQQASSSASSSWIESKHAEAVGLQDRNYTVFRGNSPLKTSDISDDGTPTGFQTWGEGRSMRFATVPMFYPSCSSSEEKERIEERQVWFITIEDNEIVSECDPSRRKEMLLRAFASWHEPIWQIVAATPPEDILMERAIAHKHSMGPVLNLNNVIRRLRRGSGNNRSSSSPVLGDGPCLVFLGDAYMTVDPILAQGFTMAMEGAYALVPSVRAACAGAAATIPQTARTSPTEDNNDEDSTSPPRLAFDPYVLRHELKRRQESRIERLICLLRATELVQGLGQPGGSGTLSGFVNTKLIRPLALLAPSFVKVPIFDAVLKYSLGLFAKKPYLNGSKR